MSYEVKLFHFSTKNLKIQILLCILSTLCSPIVFLLPKCQPKKFFISKLHFFGKNKVVRVSPAVTTVRKHHNETRIYNPGYLPKNFSKNLAPVVIVKFVKISVFQKSAPYVVILWSDWKSARASPNLNLFSKFRWIVDSRPIRFAKIARAENFWHKKRRTSHGSTMFHVW